MGLIRMVLRHRRSNRVIDVLKAYAEQGKEPPPEVLAALRAPDAEEWAERHGAGGFGWTIPFFLFVALCVAFVFFGHFLGREDIIPFYFVAIIMGGLAMGFLAKGVLSFASQIARQEKDKGPPQ